MTKLKAINVFLLQWFCIRLTKHKESRIENFKVHSVDLMPNGSISSRGTGETVDYEWYSIQYWIVPLTGWRTDYIFLNKKAKYKRITNKQTINNEND